MIRFPAALAVLCAGFLASSAAFGVDIQNQDQTAYQVTVLEGQETDTFILEPGMKEPELCGTKCKIRVEGVGEIEAEENELVLIRNGKLEKRS